MGNLKIQVVEGNLVTDSRVVAEVVGKRHDHLIRDIKKYVAVLDENPNLGTHNFFIEHSYKSAQNKEMPCYLLTKKGCDMVANKLTGEKGILFTATYVTRFEEMESELKTKEVVHSYMIDDPIKRAEKWIEEHKEKEKLTLENKELAVEINYKSNVIQGFSDEITLAEKRQILNQVIRKGGVEITQARWTLLYKNYEAKHHINLRIQSKNYNEKNKPKLKGKLDYIDKVRNDVDGLYEIACKLFESDIKKLTNELYELRKNDSTDVILLG